MTDIKERKKERNLKHNSFPDENPETATTHDQESRVSLHVSQKEERIRHQPGGAAQPVVARK